MGEYGVDLYGSGERPVLVSITMILIIPRDAGILMTTQKYISFV